MNATLIHAETEAPVTISYLASCVTAQQDTVRGQQCQHVIGRLRVYIRNATDLPRQADGEVPSSYVNVYAYALNDSSVSWATYATRSTLSPQWNYNKLWTLVLESSSESMIGMGVMLLHSPSGHPIQHNTVKGTNGERGTCRGGFRGGGFRGLQPPPPPQMVRVTV